MKKLLQVSLLFLLLCSLEVNAQNYRPFVSNKTSLFRTGGSFYAMHEDSVLAEGTGFSSYFIKTLDPDYTSDENDCRPYTSMWTGPKFYSSDNDSCAFFNQNDDSIIFLPSKSLNATWKLYKYANGNYLEARVSQKELLTFIGLTDSVKTISLQLKDAGGSNVTDPINAVTFKLSKNYGILKATAFLDFPSTYPVYELVGLSSPALGIQLLKPREIYNYDIGDEFHYESSQSSPPYSNYGYSTKTINHITNKYISGNNDTVIYTIQQNKETTTYNFQTQTSSVAYEVNEIKQKYIFDDEIDYYPGQYIVDNNDYGYYGMAPYYMVTTDDPNGRLGWTSYDMEDVYYNGTCWQNILTDNLQTSYIYIEGCGCTLMDNDITPGTNHERMVYYKKGNSQSGTPLLLSTYSKKDQTSLTLYPNPLKQGEPLHFRTANFIPTQLIVYNAVGKMVLESALTEVTGTSTINLSLLQPGVYAIQLINRSNEIVTSKLIIK